MTYYRAIIIAAAMLILLLIAAARDKKKGRLSGWGFVLIAVAALGMFLTNSSTRTTDDMTYYNKIYSSSKIEVADAKGERAVDLPNTEGPTYYSHCGERPVKAKAKDIQETAKLTFVSEPWNSRITLSLCRITNTDRYPDDAIYNYKGINYCLLATKFLYKRTFLYLEEGYVTQVLEKVLE